MKIDARGKQCPLPVIEAKNALKDAPEGEIMEILVDNEIAVQNLLKMADHKGLTSSSTKTGDREYLVKIVAGASGEEALKKLEEETSLEPEKKDERRRGMVAVISADHMGEGRSGSGSSPFKRLSLCADAAGGASADRVIL